MSGNKKEVWKDIPGYEGWYQASSFGRVRGLSRLLKINRKKTLHYRSLKGTTLKPRIRSNYYSVTLRKEGKSKDYPVHRVVAKTFLPMVEGKDQVNHKNGNKLDNTVGNLEWCSLIDNRRHAYTTGLQEKCVGFNSHFCKKSEDTLLKIVQLLKEGMSDSTIARKLNIGRLSVSRINTGTAWRVYTKKIVGKYPIKKVRHLNQHTKVYEK